MYLVQTDENTGGYDVSCISVWGLYQDQVKTHHWQSINFSFTSFITITVCDQLLLCLKEEANWDVEYYFIAGGEAHRATVCLSMM